MERDALSSTTEAIDGDNIDNSVQSLSPPLYGYHSSVEATFLLFSTVLLLLGENLPSARQVELNNSALILY